MNNKFCVSLEAARLLKEKGYNEETEYAIDNNGCIWMGEYRDECDFPCPTKAEAIDWLESKGIVVEVVFDCNIQRWHFSIYKEEKAPWIKHLSNDTFQTRLEAEEAAIIKACELL